MQSYTMNEVLPFSKEGVADIVKFIEKNIPEYKIEDVQDDEQYRKEDVDFLLTDDKNKIHKIEVKTDRKYYTGNYFFETVSNTSKNTVGCFLYSEADFLFYYFKDQNELHMIPFKKTREWFLENENRFETKYSATPDNNGEILYNTKGKIVSRKTVEREVKGIVIVDLLNNQIIN